MNQPLSLPGWRGIVPDQPGAGSPIFHVLLEVGWKSPRVASSTPAPGGFCCKKITRTILDGVLVIRSCFLDLYFETEYNELSDLVRSVVSRTPIPFVFRRPSSSVLPSLPWLTQGRFPSSRREVQSWVKQTLQIRYRHSRVNESTKILGTFQKISVSNSFWDI